MTTLPSTKTLIAELRAETGHRFFSPRLRPSQLVCAVCGAAVTVSLQARSSSNGGLRACPGSSAHTLAACR